MKVKDILDLICSDSVFLAYNNLYMLTDINSIKSNKNVMNCDIELLASDCYIHDADSIYYDDQETAVPYIVIKLRTDNLKDTKDTENTEDEKIGEVFVEFDNGQKD